MRRLVIIAALVLMPPVARAQPILRCVDANIAAEAVPPHRDSDPVFNAAITQLRQLLANGLPPSMVGETYEQLLQVTDPEQNVVVASPRKPFATQGANALIEPAILAENQISAVPFTCS
jgi:hypothetical protein